MSFVHYRIVLRLLTPLHIGKRKYRNLMETREYVPGRTLWGALTARITRDYFCGNSDNYKNIGDFFIQNFRFGYLWPSLDAKTPYFPWEHGDFDYFFKFGYMGQPIDYDRKSTEEGQLHEVEFIGPKTRKGGQVYLIGDLWIKDTVCSKGEKGEIKITVNSKEVPLRNIFDALQLGGERGYGWGRVKCEEFEEYPSNGTIYNADANTSGNEVILEFKEDSLLPAHALAADWTTENGAISKEISGPIEPLTGYEFKGGWNLVSPPICYVPGCKITSEMKAKVGVYGILASI